MSEEIEILIVEESVSQAEQLKHILEQHDHKVSIEHTARPALARIRQHKPQIIVSAVMLPEMDGYALCREIKADEQLKDIPVILLTSLSDTTDIIRGMECGADNFVTKPYDEKLLMSRIEYIVLNRELRVGAGTQTGLEIVFNGEKYSITPERQQIVDLLISTYETAVQKNLELVRMQQELNALNERLEEKIEERTIELKAEVAEHLAAEESLKEQQDFFSAVINTNPNPVFVKDTEGRYTLANIAMAELYGTTPEAMLGKTDEDFNRKKEEVKSFLQQDKEVIETARPILIPEEGITNQKTGEVSWFQTIKTPLLKPDGRVQQILGIATDITERKRAEAERDAERKLLDALINQLPVGVLFRDVTGRHTRANEAAALLADIEPDKLSEMSALEVVRAVRATRPDGSPLKEEDIPPITGQRRDRSTGPLEVLLNPVKGAARRATISISPVALEGEEPFGSVVVINDVTEQYSLQEQLQQSQKMKAIGTLTGGVAHDFNNLLTVILGNTHLALRTLQFDNPLQLRLVEVEKAANRAALLTRQLLAFSRRQHLERRSINLNHIISEIMKLLRRIIGEDVEVRVIATTGLSAVFADPAQIEQIIMNLAVNARDSMTAGGQLTIETSNITLDKSYQHRYPDVKHGKYVQITVSDTGTGMDAETQKHIFEPFFTTKEVGKGTGLGLSMVYGIVKQHDGHINVYSELGHGTTIKIFLPVVESAVELEAPEIQLPLLVGGTETILVAEDEEPLRRLAKDILEGLGYTVLMAKNGEEAVERYEQNRERIDMLLFDVVMPRMSGWEAYERIHELGGDMPLIFMTGYSSETVQSRFIKRNESMEESGAVVLQKPYNVEGLGRKVREVLDTKRRK